jgi:tetratricopeptide (TPR) repeat protein
MIFLSLTGCAPLREMEGKRKVQGYLMTAQKLFDQGDYAGSLKENQKILSLYDNIPPGDEALFNTGIIYADYGYSKRNYKESLDLFKRLVKVFPQSPLAGQAKIWIGMLQENERLNGKIEELNRTVRESRQQNQRLDREIEGLNKALNKSKQENEGLILENERLNREIEELNKTIKNSKQIDIEIDKKKKELSK